MRLDKFLQVSRLVKRRALANRLCGAGRVTVNGRRAEPAAPVRPGDIIDVEVGDQHIRARVRDVPANPRPSRPPPARGRGAAQAGPDAKYCEILAGEFAAGNDVIKTGESPV
ncbi:MAG TPA: S4 domain-containing protein [bacterium]|nr:S4 domain-containing protein [bacterium]